MGCRKLTYQITESPLKVVYRKAIKSENIAQRFISVDPLAEQFFNWSTYNYTMDNPINLIDPTGKAPEGDYFTEGGIYLGSDEMNDGLIHTIDETNWYNTVGINNWSRFSPQQKKETLMPWVIDSYEKIETPQKSTTTNNHNDSKEIAGAMGDVSNIVEGSKIGTKLPKAANGFLKKLGPMGDAIEAGEIVEEYFETRDAKQLLKNSSQMVGESFAESLMLQPHPVGKVLGVIGWFVMKASEGPDRTKEIIMPENWGIEKGQDNLRPIGTGGGF